MRKKKHGYKYFFQVMGGLFSIILILVFIINVIVPNRKFYEKENRVLASRPEMDVARMSTGKYQKSYEAYVNDQFFGRDFWVTVKASADRLLGRTDANGVYLCKDGYLMEAFQPPSQEHLDATVNAMKDFAVRHSELQQYALIVPNAAEILKDKLPAAAPSKSQSPYLDATRDALEKSGVTFIDVRDILTQHNEDGIYYRTDHHWTTQGAYFAYLQAAEVMGLDSSLVSYEKLPVTNSFQGTLSAKSGFRSSEKEEIDVFLPKEDSLSSVVTYVDEQKKSASFYAASQLDGRDKYALFFDGNHPKVVINTPTQENRTLLILKDSYANCFVPFLAQHYRTIVMIDPRYYYGDLEELIQVENIQEILYLYNANTFFSDTSLELALAPGEEG